MVRSSQGDLIDVVEAAYELGGDQKDWLGGIVTAASPLLGRGLGLTACAVDVRRDGTLRVSMPVTVGSPRGWRRIFDAMNEPGPRDHEIRAAYVNPRPVETMSTTLGGAAYATLLPLVTAYGHPIGMHDWLAVKAIDPTGIGCVLTAPLPKISGVPGAFGRRWGRVAAHLAAGYRLRSRLRNANVSKKKKGTPDPTIGAAAILGRGFAVEHAVGAAETREARAMLRAAAVAMDRARARLRRTDPDEALAIWHGLVDARWSLVDHFERGGKRYVVARENQPVAPPDARLTDRERLVVGLAALGHANKLIAYDIGVTESAISMCLARAAAKLGVPSRAALVAAYVAATARGAAPSRRGGS